MDEESRTEAPKEEPISAAATSPAFDPAMLARLASMLGAMQGSAPSAASNLPQGSSANANPTGDGLSAVLSNPAMLEKLPQIMAMLKPMLEAQPAATTAAAVSAQNATLPTAAHSHMTDRDNLLLALKPFLSSGRRDAVDSILRIAKLGELFKNMQ